MTPMTLSDTSITFSQYYSEIPRFKKVIDTIIDSIKFRHSETCGTLLVGNAGCGKSRLAKNILSKFKQMPTADKEHLFGVYVETPDTSLNDLYIEILKTLGDPAPHKGTIAQKKRRVITLVNNLDVKIIFLDEVQVALPSSGLLPTSKFVKHIKELINKTHCAWVLIGVPEAQTIKNVDCQLADRFPRVLELQYLSCETPEKILDLVEYLGDLLSKFERKIPYFKCLNEFFVDDGIALKSDLNFDNLLRFCFATMAKPRRIRDILMECLELTAPDEKVTKGVMLKAFNNLYPTISPELCPFTSPIGQVKKALIERGLYAE